MRTAWSRSAWAALISRASTWPVDPGALAQPGRIGGERLEQVAPGRGHGGGAEPAGLDAVRADAREEEGHAQLVEEGPGLGRAPRRHRREADVVRHPDRHGERALALAGGGPVVELHPGGEVDPGGRRRGPAVVGEPGGGVGLRLVGGAEDPGQVAEVGGGEGHARPRRGPAPPWPRSRRGRWRRAWPRRARPGPRGRRGAAPRRSTRGSPSPSRRAASESAAALASAAGARRAAAGARAASRAARRAGSGSAASIEAASRSATVRPSKEKVEVGRRGGGRHRRGEPLAQEEVAEHPPARAPRPGRRRGAGRRAPRARRRRRSRPGRPSGRPRRAGRRWSRRARWPPPAPRAGRPRRRGCGRCAGAPGGAATGGGAGSGGGGNLGRVGAGGERECEREESLHGRHATRGGRGATG